ncbi:MAG: hypothetical protein HLUCCO16_00315 [Phormidium sp. OSCR]|nr:MAG: hypothetical protein HLUCCO16_00315 [Phormidium sp. OSCR]
MIAQKWVVVGRFFFREWGIGNREQGKKGKRQEARGKRQEARGKRQEARGKRQEGALAAAFEDLQEFVEMGGEGGDRLDGVSRLGMF